MFGINAGRMSDRGVEAGWEVASGEGIELGLVVTPQQTAKKCMLLHERLSFSSFFSLSLFFLLGFSGGVFYGFDEGRLEEVGFFGCVIAGCGNGCGFGGFGIDLLIGFCENWVDCGQARRKLYVTNSVLTRMY